jgi:limonene-1,2-epoxide hydrolase
MPNGLKRQKASLGGPLVVIGLILIAVAGPVDAQATGKAPSSYNQQEREAVEVVKGWINAWKTYDIAKLMSFMSDDLIYRADDSEPLQHGKDGFETMARRVGPSWCGMDLQEIFVVGGEWDTVVLAKRIDYFPGGRGGPFQGIAVPVAAMFRIKNGKIMEWLDAPLIPVGPGAPPPPGAPGRGAAGRGRGAAGPGRGGPPPTPVGPCL